MPTLNKLAPNDFAKLHRQMFEGIVGPLAQGIGAKSLSTKLHMEASGRQREPDVALVFDNIKEIEDTTKGSLPLKKAYAADELLANEAASAAAKATGGFLTPESARFLPEAYRADYERITGLQIDGKAGTAVPGISIKPGPGGNIAVKIDFEKALAGATAKDVVLALTDRIVISASRLDGGVADPSIPPYWIVISPREGKLDDTWLTRNSGSSGFSSPDRGSLIRAGTETLKFEKGMNATSPFMTMTFTLDKVNDYGDATVKPASDATKPVRDGWAKFFKESDGYFDLSSSKLEKLSLAEARDLPGAATLFKAIRDNSGSSITRLVKNGTLELARDPATKSVAVLRSVEGESEQWLSVLDESKKKWVGTWAVSDDGTKDWAER